jgi:hypothetical protein
VTSGVIFREAAYTSAGHCVRPEISATSVLCGRKYADETVEVLLPTLSIMCSELEIGASAIHRGISYTVYLIRAAAVLRGYAGGVGPAVADGIVDGSSDSVRRLAGQPARVGQREGGQR